MRYVRFVIRRGENNCFSKMRKCSYCNKLGHVKDDCLKLKSRNASMSNNTQKVNIIKNSGNSSAKYYMTITVNGCTAEAFIDFGSSCITITESLAKQLSLDLQNVSSNSVIKGFGGSHITPLAETLVTITADEATCENVKAYLVPDGAQDIGIIVGQPFTDYPNVYVIKTPVSLRLYNANYLSHLPDISEDAERVKLHNYTQGPAAFAWCK